MNQRKTWPFIGVLFFIGFSVAFLYERAAASQQEEPLISVLNPLGKLPSITLVPLAPRPDRLDGRTVYFVDSGFPTTDKFMRELAASFAKSMPNVKTEFRAKIGSFFDDDPKLWTEIKEKKALVVLGVGH
ncbi:MAG: hypothetical protein ABSB94_20280 [Syntrophorhabdales bacterium]|jgi:hypothetical protein